MAENENTFLNADHIYEDVEGESGKSLNLEADQKVNLAGLISNRFQLAEDSRQIHERRWLTAYQNYRGLYGKNIRFRESEKSRVFVKVTKTKVLAAFGQLIDVIFGTGKFPIGIRETKMPEGEVSQAHLDSQNPSPGIETTPAEPVESNEPEANPFDVYKSAGFGIRIFMPMFGLLGLDWGYRFDDIPGRTDPNSRTEIHFRIGGNINGW